MKREKSLILLDRIEQLIYFIRGEKIMFDTDLASLYDVSVKVLVQAVKRNYERFPQHFMFQLKEEEWDSLRSQIVTLKKGRGKHRKYLPFAFTEQGVSMLSSVLRSRRAIQVNIAIMDTFVRLRRVLYTNLQLAQKMEELERLVAGHDEAIQTILISIRKMMNPSRKRNNRPMGFNLIPDNKS